MLKVSVIIPVYNEAATIFEIVDRIQEYKNSSMEKVFLKPPAENHVYIKLMNHNILEETIILKLYLDTVTPNFDKFLIKIDDNDVINTMHPVFERIKYFRSNLF
jgi:hypothetical protein